MGVGAFDWVAKNWKMRMTVINYNDPKNKIKSLIFPTKQSNKLNSKKKMRSKGEKKLILVKLSTHRTTKCLKELQSVAIV